MASQQETKVMGLGKEASLGDVLGWPSMSMWGVVARMLGVCGQPCEYGDIPKTLDVVCH